MTGLNANSRQIDVVGNNVANTNTTAFKSSRLMFSTMFSRTLSLGSAPADTTGGTNPYQIGLGVNTSGTQRNTLQGTISPTGDNRDLAVDGKGYFVVQRGPDTLYTRAGAFRQNAEGVLTTISGERLQGYGIDENFNITTGSIGDITIPLGGITIAEATTDVRLAGNLRADGALPTQGSRVQLGSSPTQGLIAIPSAAPAAPSVLASTSRLLDIEDPLVPGSGTALLSLGQRIELRNAEKGGKTVPTASLDVGAATTVADLQTFLADALGIDTTTGANPDGLTPGITLDPTTGLLTIVGNTGTVNNIELDGSDLRVLDATGAVVRTPFVPAEQAAATGESVRTTFVIFDSLGGTVPVDVSLSLESRSNGGTVWRYAVETEGNTGVPTRVGSGTVSFDPFGQPLSRVPVTVSIDRAESGAATPLAFDLSFATLGGGLTSLSDTRSAIAVTFQNGSEIGTLSSFGIGDDGLVSGKFSNGLSRPLGQIVLATFANAEGLEEAGSNLWRPAPNSGPASVTTPGLLGSGSVVSGSLELSNVDLGEEFIKLVLASTGYSANSRVIRTTDELMQQLLVLGR
jgi:flagellar hook protein FlgE